jgi:hypothetical protein
MITHFCRESGCLILFKKIEVFQHSKVQTCDRYYDRWSVHKERLPKKYKKERKRENTNRRVWHTRYNKDCKHLKIIKDTKNSYRSALPKNVLTLFHKMHDFFSSMKIVVMKHLKLNCFQSDRSHSCTKKCDAMFYVLFCFVCFIFCLFLTNIVSWRHAIDVKLKFNQKHCVYFTRKPKCYKFDLFDFTKPKQSLSLPFPLSRITRTPKIKQ